MGTPDRLLSPSATPINLLEQDVMNSRLASKMRRAVCVSLLAACFTVVVNAAAGPWCTVSQCAVAKSFVNCSKSFRAAGSMSLVFEANCPPYPADDDLHCLVQNKSTERITSSEALNTMTPEDRKEVLRRAVAPVSWPI